MDEKTNLMTINLDKFLNNKILSLEENHKFLNGIYTTRMKESISFMRFIIQKFNTEDTFANFKKINLNNNNNKDNKDKQMGFLGEKILISNQQRESLLENLYKNYIKIGKFAKKFDDEFLANFSEIIIDKKLENLEDNFINKNFIRDYVTKQELLNYFADNKEDIFFELFYNYDNFYLETKKSPKNLMRFYLCNILSEFSNVWLEYFNPEFNVTNPQTKDFINQFKAVNYIYYNIKEENYIKAYANLEYIHPSNEYINKLKLPLEKLSKTQIFCDIIEAHVEGTQKYKEEITERKGNLNLQI